MDRGYISADDVKKAADMAEDAVGKKRFNTTRSKCERYLKYQFTESEKKSLSEELARNVKERDSAKNELNSIKGQFGARIKQSEAAILEYAEKVTSGYEYRPTECEEIKDFNAGMVTVRRCDSWEVVESRRMTGADRQMVIKEE